MSITRVVKPRLGLNKKSVVIDVDFLISYLLFIFLVVLVVQFITSLATPFNDNAYKTSKEKATLAVSSMLGQQFSINEFSKACEINYSNIARLSVYYEVKGFYAPSDDHELTLPNESEGVVFFRQGNELRVLVGNNETAKRILVRLTSDKPVAVANSSLEESDNLTVSLDSFNNQLIIFESLVGNNDLDELIITVNERTLFTHVVSGTEQLSIGGESLTGYCGSRGVLAPKTSFQGYGWLNDDENIYPSIITGEVWWTS